jgi:hypothetical protein
MTARRPAVENLEDRQLLSTLGASDHNVSDTAIPIKHVPADVVQRKHIDSAVVQRKHVGFDVVQRKHIGADSTRA